MSKTIEEKIKLIIDKSNESRNNIRLLSDLIFSRENMLNNEEQYDLSAVIRAWVDISNGYLVFVEDEICEIFECE